MDEPPDQLFPGLVRRMARPDEKYAIRYLCNLVFKDHLQPRQNTKFPGPMVVSVARSNIGALQGVIPSRKPYKQAELSAWLKERTWPTLPSHCALETPYEIRESRMPRRRLDLRVVDLDFGSNSGLFELPEIGIRVHELDFGPVSGEFQI